MPMLKFRAAIIAVTLLSMFFIPMTAIPKSEQKTEEPEKTENIAEPEEVEEEKTPEKEKKKEEYRKMNETYEQEIDLKWLVYRVLRAWRPIVVWAIIIGFVIGSIPSLIPVILNMKDFYIGIIISFVSFYLSYKMTK